MDGEAVLHQQRRRRRLLEMVHVPSGKRYIALFAVAALLFAWGFAAGRYKVFPYSFLVDLKQTMIFFGAPEGESRLLIQAFSDPLVSNTQLLPEIRSPSGIKEFNDSIFIPASAFVSAYNRIAIRQSRYFTMGRSNRGVIEVRFDLDGRTHSAFAYAGREPECEAGGTASLIIPPTGDNQSTDLARGSRRSEASDLWAVLDNVSNTFVLIKPNQDVYAAHHSGRKLNSAYVYNYLLSRGGSYGVSYVTQSLALSRYLKDCFENTIVAGHSQGGEAALLNALQSQPTLAIISSGYSIFNSVIEESGPDQIILPGVSGEVLAPAPVRRAVARSQTEFLLTGSSREEGVYRLDYRNRRTCDYFARVGNVTCIVHEGGHRPPRREIEAFVRRHAERWNSPDRS